MKFNRKVSSHQIYSKITTAIKKFSILAYTVSPTFGLSPEKEYRGVLKIYNDGPRVLLSLKLPHSVHIEAVDLSC